MEELTELTTRYRAARSAYVRIALERGSFLTSDAVESLLPGLRVNHAGATDVVVDETFMLQAPADLTFPDPDHLGQVKPGDPEYIPVRGPSQSQAVEAIRQYGRLRAVGMVA